MDNTSSSTCLSHEWAATCFNSFTSNRANRIARNAVTSMDVMAAARDISVMPTYHDTFGIKLKHTGDTGCLRRLMFFGMKQLNF